MLEEPADKLHGIEGGSSWASTARLTVGAGDSAVFEAHETSIGDGASEDSGGEVLEGRVAIVARLRVNIPGDVPDVWVDVLEQSGLAHIFFADGSVDGREGLHGDKAVGSRGEPDGAVLGESTARDDVMDVGVLLELSSPGVQDAGKPREVGPDAALVFGEAFESERRGVAQGLVGEALMGAEQGARGCRDGAGEEAVRPWELFVQGALKPLLGCMVLTLWTVAGATGMMDAVLFSTAWASIEALSIVPALAMLDRTDDLAV
jgi:hypothetical protein